MREGSFLGLEFAGLEEKRQKKKKKTREKKSSLCIFKFGGVRAGWL